MVWLDRLSSVIHPFGDLVETNQKRRGDSADRTGIMGKRF
jgi:hypothetical protein